MESSKDAAKPRRRPREPEATALCRSLRRTAAAMVRRLERRFADEDGDVDERDVKTLAALMAAVAKMTEMTELEANPGKRRDGKTVEDPSGPETGDSDVPRQVLDALEALVDGRAAGVDRLAGS